MNKLNPYAAPITEVSEAGESTNSSLIHNLSVSENWKHKFYLIERAGGVKLPKFKELSFGDRLKANYNLLAFLFGPIYYLVKGMWRKAIVFSVACLAVIMLLEVALELLGMGSLGSALGYGAAAFFAVRANIDYYKKMVLKQNGWW